MPNKKKKGFRRRRPEVRTLVKKQSNRTVKRKLWGEQEMLAAIDAVVKGGLSRNQAADTHGVPRSTLKDRLSGRVVHGVNPGPRPYLTADEERELAAHLIQASDIGFGKTRRDVCCLVETYLKQQGRLKGDSISNGWWGRFLKRNPSIRLRSGDSTAGVRFDAINKENIEKYFDLLWSANPPSSDSAANPPSSDSAANPPSSDSAANPSLQ